MDKEIFKIASNTKNLSFLDKYTHSSNLKNATCGDKITIFFILKNNKITNFKYKSESCIYCQASASLLSRNIKNKPINKVKDFLKQAPELFKNNEIYLNKEWKTFLKIMNKTNFTRKACLLLPIKATLKAFKTK